MIKELEILDRTSRVLSLIDSLPYELRGDLKLECLYIREKLLDRCSKEVGSRRTYGPHTHKANKKLKKTKSLWPNEICV